MSTYADHIAINRDSGDANADGKREEH